MIKRTQCPSIFILPGLRDVSIRQLQSFDQQKNSNTVGNHIQWVSLHHILPNMNNIGRPIPVSQDYRGVVTISVLKQTSSRRP